jgi:hypothetical protein
MLGHRIYKEVVGLGLEEAENYVELEVHIITVPLGSACETVSRMFVELSNNKGKRVLELSRVIMHARRSLNCRGLSCFDVLIQCEVRGSSSSCLQDWHSPIFRSRVPLT